MPLEYLEDPMPFPIPGQRLMMILMMISKDYQVASSAVNQSVHNISLEWNTVDFLVLNINPDLIMEKMI